MVLRKRTLKSLNTLTAHNRAALVISPAIRSAFGVAIPILIGILMGHMLSGVGVSIGALVAGFAGMTGTARKRTRTMLLASTWMSVATFIGALVGYKVWMIVAVISLSGFVAAMMVAVSAEAAQVGLLSTNALILISYAPQSPKNAVIHALLVLAGGLFQTLLMILSDLASRKSAETIAVADAYAAISNYAKEHTRETDLLVASSLLDADKALDDSYFKHTPWARLRSLMNSAEQIRMYIVTLGGISKRLRNHPNEQQLEEIEDVLRTVADILATFALCIRTSEPLPDSVRPTISGLFQISFNREATNQSFVDAKETTFRLYDALTSVCRVLEEGSDRGGMEPLYFYRTSPAHQLQRVYTIWRANFTFRSATFRHAIRVVISLAVAALLDSFLPLSRGYWLPLTTLIILKPDFTSTFSRGIARVFGTIGGVVMATALVAIPDNLHLLGVILIIIFCFGMYALVNYNYALFTCVLTAEIVVLLSFFQQTPPGVTMVNRLIDTVVGSLLAFTAYAVWPTWQHRNVSEAIANVVHSQRLYLASIVCVDETPARTASLRKESRLARTNAVSTVRQSMIEPVNQSLDHHAVWGMLTCLHRLSDVLLSLNAYFLHHDKSAITLTCPLERAKRVIAALDAIEMAIRNHEAAPPSLISALGTQNAGHPPAAVLTPEPSMDAQVILTRLHDVIRTMTRMLPLMTCVRSTSKLGPND